MNEQVVCHKHILNNFNTSHVLIYPKEFEKVNPYKEFQYISCSYLSEKRTGIYQERYNFNTSHVLIYLAEICKNLDADTHFNTSHLFCSFFSHRSCLACSIASQIIEINCMIQNCTQLIMDGL